MCNRSCSNPHHDDDGDCYDDDDGEKDDDDDDDFNCAGNGFERGRDQWLRLFLVSAAPFYQTHTHGTTHTHMVA